jgi:uncharacterized protein
MVVGALTTASAALIPAWHSVLERVYIYKAAHHPRLESDYKQPAINAAIATAAGPTFLKPHMTESAVELVDGGVWANNPIGVAVIEAIGMLGWPRDKLKILSIGTIKEPGKLPRLRGKLPMAASVVRLFMAGQAHSALGTAKITTGITLDSATAEPAPAAAPADALATIPAEGAA